MDEIIPSSNVNSPGLSIWSVTVMISPPCLSTEEMLRDLSLFTSFSEPVLQTSTSGLDFDCSSSSGRPSRFLEGKKRSKEDMMVVRRKMLQNHSATCSDCLVIRMNLRAQQIPQDCATSLCLLPMIRCNMWSSADPWYEIVDSEGVISNFFETYEPWRTSVASCSIASDAKQ